MSDPDTASPKPPSRIPLPHASCRSILVLAGWFGLLGGLLDLAMIFARKDWLHATHYHEQGRHFVWTVPLAHLGLLIAAGLLIAIIVRLRPGLISIRSAAFILATMALWGPLLRAPIHGLAGLVVAIGAARLLSRWISSHPAGFLRFATASLAVLMVILASTTVISLRSESRAETRARASLPVPPTDAPNVLLLVMDTVRAESLALHGYNRNTTPQLMRWAKKGVKFDWALSAAPWTFPSHSSFLTGQWPSTLDAHWNPVLDSSFPTLAEFLALKGYVTGGFAANTFWCSYESRLDRGFVHYEDYPLTPATILGSTMPGRWLLENLRDSRDYYASKWIRSQSRDAAGINRAFLDWIAGERSSGRPFFAFLNYLDAHEPFLPPRDAEAHFGLRPESVAEHRMLLDYWDRDKLALTPREVELARDAYDDCIAALDRQVGALLEELDRRAMLGRTLVIVTSDHGEAFGEHGVFNHGFSLYANEVHVPLLIFWPGAPAGRTMTEPVSLRDIPATVVDLLGLAAGSPFPGVSLARAWRPRSSNVDAGVSTALSEVDIPMEIIPQRGRGANQRGFAMSLVGEGMHYVLDSRGTEELYDLATDGHESKDLRNEAARAPALERFRNALGEILQNNPAIRGAGTASLMLKQLRSLIGAMAPRPRI